MPMGKSKMQHGGKRTGAGRPKGSKNKPALQLQVEEVQRPVGKSQAQRMRALKQQVALLVSDGMPPGEIAAVLGFSEEKLKAVFQHELTHGKQIIRAQALAQLAAAGEGGNVAASKAILANADGDAPKTNEKSGDPDRDRRNAAALTILNGGKL